MLHHWQGLEKCYSEKVQDVGVALHLPVQVKITHVVFIVR